jgi:long-chain acyl-CoA synthetase
MIEGNSLKDYIIAIVVPDQVYLMDYCQKANIGGDFKTLCESKYVKRIILEDLIKYGKLGGLMSYEQVCGKKVLQGIFGKFSFKKIHFFLSR